MSLVDKAHTEKHLDDLAKKRSRQTGEDYYTAYVRVLDTDEGRLYYSLGVQSERNSDTSVHATDDRATIAKKLSQEQQDQVWETILQGAHDLQARSKDAATRSLSEAEAVARYLQTDEGQRLYVLYVNASPDKRALRL